MTSLSLPWSISPWTAWACTPTHPQPWTSRANPHQVIMCVAACPSNWNLGGFQCFCVLSATFQTSSSGVSQDSQQGTSQPKLDKKTQNITDEFREPEGVIEMLSPYSPISLRHLCLRPGVMLFFQDVKPKTSRGQHKIPASAIFWGLGFGLFSPKRGQRSS